MQKLKTFAAIAAIIMLAASAVGGAFYLSRDYLARGDSQTQELCKGDRRIQELVIRDNHFDRENLQAHRCESLTIRNADDTTRLIAFGQHDHHRVYDGVTERLLKQGESFTITLSEIGSFTIHDHLHDEVESRLTVSQ